MNLQDDEETLGWVGVEKTPLGTTETPNPTVGTSTSRRWNSFLLGIMLLVTASIFFAMIYTIYSVEQDTQSEGTVVVSETHVEGDDASGTHDSAKGETEDTKETKGGEDTEVTGEGLSELTSGSEITMNGETYQVRELNETGVLDPRVDPLTLEKNALVLGKLKETADDLGTTDNSTNPDYEMRVKQLGRYVELVPEMKTADGVQSSDQDELGVLFDSEFGTVVGLTKGSWSQEELLKLGEVYPVLLPFSTSEGRVVLAFRVLN